MNKILTVLACLSVFMAEAQNPASQPKKQKYIPVDWKHYNANPNYKPTTLKTGVTGNVNSMMISNTCFSSSFAKR